MSEKISLDSSDFFLQIKIVSLNRENHEPYIHKQSKYILFK